MQYPTLEYILKVQALLRAVLFRAVLPILFLSMVRNIMFFLKEFQINIFWPEIRYEMNDLSQDQQYYQELFHDYLQENLGSFNDLLAYLLKFYSVIIMNLHSRE